MSLAARLTAIQHDGRLPTVVAGVLRDGVLAETAGVHADVGTAYRIGSITKTFTAVLVLQLRDEGRVSLDDRLDAHVPDTSYGGVSLGDLLGHTGGLQAEPTGPWWERSTGGSFAELVAADDGTGAVAAPGEWFHYSNLGYGLLGELVARLHGASWLHVVREQLLEPLGMSRTTWGPVAPHAQGRSVRHFTGQLDDEPHTDTGAMGPAGQLWSTVADLATWAGVLLGRRPDLLAEATAAEMRTPRLDPTYGLGLQLAELGGRSLVGHPGSMPGFQSVLFVEPDTGDGAVVLTNATTGLDVRAAVPALLADAASDAPRVEPWIPTTSLPADVEPLLGVWFWGNTATEWRWQHDRLELRRLQVGTLTSTFVRRDDGVLVGDSGYHRGETLHVHEHHLECATFLFTRAPYDPRVFTAVR
ncbi:serine hydrolase domain-containing protein [Nocardioides sp. C4-1]|uniref:serine hydrolase domain-containing protein n=1 Tax=Nocardioides sp. C4-1 TaxID=3151851 RepID=UPI0032644B05